MNAALSLAHRLEPVPPILSRPLIALVFEGLSEDDKRLPPVLLHDGEGSALFARVCEQPEYYLERAEARLLRAHGREIAALAGPRAAVVEYGSGSGRLARVLLASLEQPLEYVPLDVDPLQLARARADLRTRFPTLPIHPVCQDFEEFVALPAAAAGTRRRVAFFPGSTVGRSRPLEAVALLASIRESMGTGGALLIGVDLVKDRAVLERAYDDAAGAMATFNRNVLVRLNREFDATFDPDQFGHRACWNATHGRVEMSLVSLRAQCPEVAGISVALAQGEEIATLQAHKHTLEGFAHLAQVAGWSVRRHWLDATTRYSLAWLEDDEPDAGPSHS